MRPDAALVRNNRLQSSPRMHRDNIRKISEDDLPLVHKLIERCLVEYKDVEEAVSVLFKQARIHPDFTRLVWKKLEEENAEFFEPYRVRLILKKQINTFNFLQRQQFEIMQAQHNQQMELMQAQHARVNQSPQVNSRDPAAYHRRPDSATFQHLIQNPHAVGFSTPPGIRSSFDTFTNNGIMGTYTTISAGHHPQGYMNFYPNEVSVRMPVGYRSIPGRVHGFSLNPSGRSIPGRARHAAFDSSSANFHSANDLTHTAASLYQKHNHGHPNLSCPGADGLQDSEGVGHKISQRSNGEDMEYSEDNGVPDQMSEAGKDDSPSC